MSEREFYPELYLEPCLVLNLETKKWTLEMRPPLPPVIAPPDPRDIWDYDMEEEV